MTFIYSQSFIKSYIQVLSLTIDGITKQSFKSDINECVADSYPCGSSSICINSDGSYRCTCELGCQGIDGSCIGLENLITTYRPLHN